MFNDIEYWVKDTQQTCLAYATEVAKYTKQFKSGHWCFCGFGQETVWHRTWDYSARKGQGSLKKPHIQHLIVLKRDLKSKRSKQTIRFQSSAQTKTIPIRTIFWHGSELSTDDFTILTHGKELTASGERMRHKQRQQTHYSSSCKGQYNVTRLR